MSQTRYLRKRTLLLQRIRAKIRKQEWELTLHAQQQSVARGVSREDMASAILKGQVIEDYLDDPRGPSCLVLGYTKQRRPLHVLVTCPQRGTLMKVITVYEPSASKWQAGWRKRRQ